MGQYEDFVKASEEVEDRDFNLAQENVISFLRGSKVATVTFTQGRYITRIKQLAEKFPKEVKITAENKDGSIVAHIPTSYIKINNVKRELTDEQREELSARFKFLRKAQTYKEEID